MMMVAGYSLLAVPTGMAAAEYSLAGSPARGGGSPCGAAGARRRGERPTLHESPDRPAVAGGVSSTSKARENRACEGCEAVGHDADASYCKYCGGALDHDSW